MTPIGLLLATTNADKLREIRAVLAHAPVDLVSLRDLPQAPEPQETGRTFQENARLKALYYDAHARGGLTVGSSTTVYTVAEDSGLIVDALDDEPGVYSARFLRPEAAYPERFAEIYRRLAAHPERPRTARFVCALALAHDGDLPYETTGIVEGEIAPAPRGTGGFGYDPIFWYPPYGTTLAAVSEEDKLRVAHRGVAFRQLAQWLERQAAAAP